MHKYTKSFLTLLQIVAIGVFVAFGLTSLGGSSNTVYAATRDCYDDTSIQGIAHGPLLHSQFSQTPNVCVGDDAQSGNQFFQIEVKLPYDNDGFNLAKDASVIVSYGTKKYTIPMVKVTTGTFISSKSFSIPIEGGGCHPTTEYLVNITAQGAWSPSKTLENIDICSSNRQPQGSDPATFTYVATVNIPQLTPRSSGNPSTSTQHIVGYIGADFGSPLSTDATSQFHALQKNGVLSLTLTKSDGTVAFSCKGDCDGKDGLELANGAFKINSSDNPTIGLGTYDLVFDYSARTAGVTLAPDEWSPHTFKFSGIIVKTAGQDVDITPGASAESLQYYDSNNSPTVIGAAEPTAEKLPPQCTGGALGWVLCPLIDVFTDIINWTAGILNDMLFIAPIGSNASLQSIWSTFVGIANLLLVIGFLVVIFSQATSIGLDAYGIKKMLPRIIAAAILINLSYFICTIALDVVNVIGGTIGGMVQAFMPDKTTLSDAKELVRGDSWQSWLGLSLAAAGAGAIAAATGAIAFVVPLLLSAAFSMVAIFLIIALRQVLVILLIIIAPLAFAAMVLPNTEQLFSKWRKLFMSMLIMYPVVMFIMYGSQLVGALVLASKSSSSADVNNWVLDIVSAIIMTIGPFGILYMYLKNQNKLLGMAAGAIDKLGAGARKATTGWAKEKQKNSRFQSARDWNKAYRDANRITRFGKTTGIQGRLNKLNSYAAGVGVGMPNKWGQNAGAYLRTATNKAAAYDNKIFKEDEENAAAEFARNGIQGPLMVQHARSGRVVRRNKDTGEYEYGRKLTEAEHAAAINWTMSQGKLEERMALYGSDWASEERNPGNRRALDALSSGYFQKDVARFGNTYGGRLGSGTAGGDISVSNAVLANMAQGKTAAEALLDNDMAQRVADVGSMSDADLVTHIQNTKALSDVATSLNLTPQQMVDKFRENAQTVTKRIYDTPDLSSRIKPEFAEALTELNSNAYNAGRTTRATKENAERVAAAAKLASGQSQDNITVDSTFNAIGQ